MSDSLEHGCSSTKRLKFVNVGGRCVCVLYQLMNLWSIDAFRVKYRLHSNSFWFNQCVHWKRFDSVENFLDCAIRTEFFPVHWLLLFLFEAVDASDVFDLCVSCTIWNEYLWILKWIENPSKCSKKEEWIFWWRWSQNKIEALKVE